MSCVAAAAADAHHLLLPSNRVTEQRRAAAVAVRSQSRGHGTTRLARPDPATAFEEDLHHEDWSLVSAGDLPDLRPSGALRPVRGRLGFTQLRVRRSVSFEEDLHQDDWSSSRCWRSAGEDLGPPSTSWGNVNDLA